MRKFKSSLQNIRFALDEQEYRNFKIAINKLRTVNFDGGITFNTALSPWALAVEFMEATGITIQPRESKTHGKEWLITAERTAVEPITDAFAIVVDGDQAKNYERGVWQYFAILIHHNLVAWYSLPVRWRHEMIKHYSEPAA